MKSDEFRMAKSTTMTVRLAPEVSEKLESLAHDTKRSKAYLAGEAIASYVELNAWQVAHIKEPWRRTNLARRVFRTMRSSTGWSHGEPITSYRRRCLKNHSDLWRSSGAQPPLTILRKFAAS